MITNDMIINYPFEYIEEQMKTEMENTDLNEMFDTYCKYSIEISGSDTWFFQVYFPIVLTILDSHYHSNEDRMYDSLKNARLQSKNVKGQARKKQYISILRLALNTTIDITMIYIFPMAYRKSRE